MAGPDHGEITFWGSFEHPNHVNPLLLRLYLDHDNISYILDNIEQIQEKFKLSLKYF